MAARWWRLLILASLTVFSVAACSTAPTSSPETAGPPVVALDLQVRNSGMRGGYIWLSGAGQPTRGRWHAFGMAEFFCVTRPEPFVGSVAGYDIAVIDLSCGVRARNDSSPADPASIPCASPA